MLERYGEQRRWPEHDLLQPDKRRILEWRTGVYAHDYGERSGSFRGRERTSRICRTNSGCGHAVPKRWTGNICYSQRARAATGSRRLRPGIAADARAGALVWAEPLGGVARDHAPVCAAARKFSRRTADGASAGWPAGG